MQRSKRAIRRAVLGRMFDLIEQTYGMEMNREQFTGGTLSHHEIDAILSFRSDPRLEELRGALERIEDGTFGVCIGCKHEIAEKTLESDPARRMCPVCEREFSKPAMPQLFSWIHQ
ncbi:MAG: hypothetical protein AB1428_14610 [Bacteroidota bacterium]